MSELSNIVAQVRLATDFQTNKQILKEKIQTDLHFAYNGGMFKADPAIYAFVVMWQGDPESLFLEDVYGTPIKIVQREFIELCTQHYQRAMNEWHQQYAELRKIRKV
jgi:hypothetical protein